MGPVENSTVKWGSVENVAFSGCISKMFLKLIKDINLPQY